MSDRRAEYDPAKLLTRSGVIFVGALILFVAIIIVVQIVTSPQHSANTESWAALTGLIGWMTNTVTMLYTNRFGSTQASAKKDAVIAQQSQTAAVIAGATGTGGAMSGGAPTGPIVADTVQVESANTVITPKESP